MSRKKRTKSGTFEQGLFLISLDFELIWGVLDSSSLETYKQNLRGVPRVVSELLKLFEEYQIHATWSTVGLLFLDSISDIEQQNPSNEPQYANDGLCPYHYVRNQGDLEHALHFCPNLIRQIRDTAGQEIGTHTYSHFYCLEKGASIRSFEADLRSAVEVAKRSGIRPASLVFPRNQWREDFLAVLPQLGIKCFRGNEKHQAYEARARSQERLTWRALRLVDSYINLTGHHTYGSESCGTMQPYNLAASRFLRPFSRKLSLLEPLKLRRISESMRHAAYNREIFHLWWHPHNFGRDLNQNIGLLRRILDEYRALKDELNLRSVNMKEVAKLLPAQTAAAGPRHSP